MGFISGESNGGSFFTGVSDVQSSVRRIDSLSWGRGDVNRNISRGREGDSTSRSRGRGSISIRGFGVGIRNWRKNIKHQKAKNKKNRKG